MGVYFMLVWQFADEHHEWPLFPLLLGVVGGVEFDAGAELLLDWVLEAVVAAEDDDELELSDELELLSSDELEDLSELDELDELEDSFFLSSLSIDKTGPDPAKYNSRLPRTYLT